MSSVSLWISSSVTVSHQCAFVVFVGGVLTASAESVWEVEGRESEGSMVTIGSSDCTSTREVTRTRVSAPAEGKKIERLLNCRLCECER